MREFPLLLPLIGEISCRTQIWKRKNVHSEWLKQCSNTHLFFISANLLLPHDVTSVHRCALYLTNSPIAFNTRLQFFIESHLFEIMVDVTNYEFRVPCLLTIQLALTSDSIITSPGILAIKDNFLRNRRLAVNYDRAVSEVSSLLLDVSNAAK